MQEKELDSELFVVLDKDGLFLTSRDLETSEEFDKNCLWTLLGTDLLTEENENMFKEGKLTVYAVKVMMVIPPGSPVLK